MQGKTPTLSYIKANQKHTHGNGHFWIYFGFRSVSRMHRLYNQEVYKITDMFDLRKRSFGTLIVEQSM